MVVLGKYVDLSCDFTVAPGKGMIEQLKFEGLLKVKKPSLRWLFYCIDILPLGLEGATFNTTFNTPFL